MNGEELVTAAGNLFDEFDTEKTGKLGGSAFQDLLNTLFPTPKFGPPLAPLVGPKNGM